MAKPSSHTFGIYRLVDSHKLGSIARCYQFAPSFASKANSICLLLVRRVPEFRGISIGPASSRRRARSRSNPSSVIRRRPSLVPSFPIGGNLSRTVFRHNVRHQTLSTMRPNFGHSGLVPAIPKAVAHEAEF
jgi:hypothetical protein